MSATHSTGRLDHIPVDKVRPNQDNPRIAFRQGELDELQESIRQFGVQVPIAVFRKSGAYVLIDGERRWRCAAKLNLKTIPALIQEEPGPLNNLLLMFNIHALREQWDLLTIALKLPRIVELLEQETGQSPNEAEIASKTGLTRGVIRRCRLLTALPERFKSLLLEELKKPKSKQQLSEDLFIEMEKSLRVIESVYPGLVGDRDSARDVLIGKYKSKVIDNIVDFRKIAKIARAGRLGADEGKLQKSLLRLVTDSKYSITRAWTDTASEAYAEKDILARIDYLLEHLAALKHADVDEDIREKLEELVRNARAILERGE